MGAIGTVRAGRVIAATLLAGAMVTLTACGGDDDKKDDRDATKAAPQAPGSAPAADAKPLKGTVTVFAAASLTETFTALGKRFEAAHPGVTVKFNYGGSSALAASINQGAPADVFASADEKNMKLVTDGKSADGAPTAFAKNTLQIAVAPGNPKNVKSLADLKRDGLKVAQCAPQVPCGAAARTALDAGGVKFTPSTLEQDVKAALTKLTLGEVDAALVYRTDVKAAGAKVVGVDFPEAAQAVNTYPIVPLAKAPNADAAKAFVAFVLAEPGRTALTAAGFQAP
ncbi:molybdate ABC transporter substrate-binding protein [Embleya scabrispora]|uniref:Molybdate ABC transporter substrate-binding protein n=1 Tax=Embleya scabrispora TaxID=159449 RepID=A0A1T3P6U6_9ACTN|nr:molybdate ABC transporter substrate-binding protein [Embleya scabrispora]OPC84809.1 molybdate ABC transporter substrate-binding protein [Embleya scabrispora]